MKNFQPGGLRNRRDDIGGRPKSDMNSYAPKQRKEGFGNNRGNDRGGKSFGGGNRFGSNDRGGNRSGAPRFGGDRERREVVMHSAVCNTCGNACEVPFRPDGSKPVLCSACYSAKGPSRDGGDKFANKKFGNDRAHTNTPAGPVVSKADYDMLAKQLVAVEDKVNQILELIKASEKIVSAMPEIAVEEVMVKSEDKKPATVKVEKKSVKTEKPAAKKAVKKVAKKEVKPVAKKPAAKKVSAKAVKKGKK